MPYGNIDLSQQWLRQWLSAWWHLAITWSNVDSSLVRFFKIHLKEISYVSIPQPQLFSVMSLRSVFVKHDDVIKWKHFPRNWPFVRWITGPGEFPPQRPVTQSLDVFFDLRLNKRLSKQPWGWWFETLSWSLWRQCNDNQSINHYILALGTSRYTDASTKWMTLFRQHFQMNFLEWNLWSFNHNQLHFTLKYAP